MIKLSFTNYESESRIIAEEGKPATVQSSSSSVDNEHMHCVIRTVIRDKGCNRGKFSCQNIKASHEDNRRKYQMDYKNYNSTGNEHYELLKEM